jgi:hypothetical protein
MFMHGIHVPSAMHDDDEFSLIGDVLNVLFHLNVFMSSFINTRFQITHLFSARTGGEYKMNTLGRLTVQGLVVGMDEGSDSFFVAPTQHIMFSHFPAPLTVMAMVAVSQTADQHLPPLNLEIFLTGEIVTYEHGLIIVTVDSHSHFPSIDWSEENGDSNVW